MPREKVAKAIDSRDRLDKGRDEDPLFIPKKIWDRPMEASRRWRGKARAILAIEALIATDTKPGKALGIIADRFPKLRAFAGPKASTLALAVGAACGLSLHATNEKRAA
jgi:hypothetical protein